MRAPPAEGAGSPELGLGSSALDPSALDPSALDSSGLDPSELDLSGLDLSGLDPSAFDPSALGLDPSRLSGIDPSQLSLEALHPMVHEALRAGTGKIALASIALAAVVFAVGMLRARTRPTERAPGPTWVAAALLLLGTYLAIRAVDPLLATTLERPSWMAEAAWAKVGWFEWKLLGRPGVALALPLADIPALALVLHIPLWLCLLWVVELILRWVYGVRPGGSVGWETKRAELPWFYRWVGSSTARRADQRFRRWVGPLVVVLMVLHVVAGLSLGEVGGPAPGAWVVAGLLLWVTAFHLITAGKKPTEREEEKELGEAAADDASVAEQSPLHRLREAAQTLRPGVAFELLEEQPGAAESRAPLPAQLAPLVGEVFEDLSGHTQPWAHQAAVLEHLAGIWTLTSSAPLSDDPTSLEEVRSRSPISSAGGAEAAHALVLGGEGSGRTTLTILAALHVFLDRGATTLVLVRTRAAAIAWVAKLGDALARSSARWNVQVALAGEDLAAPLLAGRTPAIVVADLEAFESEVLCDRRTDDLLGRLGLVVVDDVDAFHGVAEMHLGLSMRRLWALGATLHRASYPVVLVATAAAGASGIDGWARHVLGVPLRVFSDDRAPALPRALLRRRDLVDTRGDDLPLAEVAQACEAAGLPWHLRLAGDDQRSIQRAALDGIGGARRHYQRDPADAAVILIEGTYPAARREATRLCHAGWRQEADRVVLVLAPPGDEEMVLHEEADDALHRDLVASLPQAVPLSEPRVVRQRHLDRALGREQDLAGLRERLGARFVDDAVEHLADAGKVRRRQVLLIDPRTDAISERTLVRADHEAALGQAISAECVTEVAECVSLVDAGTSEVLLRCELAIAGAVYPPGRIFLHPQGRYVVLDGDGADGEGDGDAAGGRTIKAERIADASRTTLERRVAIEVAEQPLDLAIRKLGGRRLAIALTRAQIREEVVGVRRIGPGPRLLEHRLLERPTIAVYGSDVCLIRGRLGEASPGSAVGVEGVDLSPAAAAPLVAALRMMIPCALRGAGELVDVAAIELGGELHLALFDRTPGASGFARHIAERSLAALLTLARLALGRLVGPELSRLWHIHDSTPGADPSAWDIAGALRWLGAILDRAAPAQAELGPQDRPRGPRCEYGAGAGRGDLGRIWVTRSGRSDDLVWTRHRWWSPQPLAGAQAGEVFLNIAVERPLVARALVDPADAEVLATLAMIRRTLGELFGESAVDGVLGLVAALPLSPRPLAAREGSPLVVLARRRADLSVKRDLAAALLPEVYTTAPVEVEGRLGLRLQRGADILTVDLAGPEAKIITE